MYVVALREALIKSGISTRANVKNVESALLTTTWLDNAIIAAESIAYKVDTEKIESLINKRNTEGFLAAVLSSALGSFLFSIVLIVLFWMGRDQIRAWLEALRDS